MRQLALFLSLLILVSCSSAEESERKLLRKGNRTGAGIFRGEDEKTLASPKLKYTESPKYPWRKSDTLITKEHFRCKGDALNPSYLLGERLIQDCKGGYHHSLPLKNNKEYIYPVLIETLNYLQDKTGKKVHILSGHRCPDHNEYIDSSRYNASSKHTIGAEVAFYIEGMESTPEKVVAMIIEHYKDDAGGSSYQEFSRYTKPDTNVSTEPWFNKEIFIKLFKKDEGRSKEITTQVPYISIQVRHDRETSQRVTYSWDLANQNFYRW